MYWRSTLHFPRHFSSLCRGYSGCELVGGFKEGVNFAMRKCRQCMATYSQIQTKVLCYYNS